MPGREPTGAAELELTAAELCAVAGYAAACARPVLALVELACPHDGRARSAVEAAQAFADGGPRTAGLRDAAWAAQRAARDAATGGHAAAGEAARAAMAAAGAAYLHPLARATQVRHILGSAAHAARALELVPGADAAAALGRARALAGPTVVEVLRRYPAAPSGGGRVGELVRALDATLR